eukprot:CAMPEP_0202872210 /NCGR_PEP_ID=MMETSP1391-20130828/20699_1 /ASSEMBLY_ACC=CAM_ASM_000867 /TAXON_ID=1034604 /ORGANISM="Chlamydomonas leiostraca, Strain SAG 11-49" /LENGTH=214 /DNA_ID=CAMNT_0049553201 /DNA_START=86 /DNA_END=730 /DNA_ORIENTATION=-
MAEPLPPLSFIKDAQLRDRTGVTISAQQLWQDQPCVVLIIRRPGCVLCRAEAQRLWKLQPELSAAGVAMAAVVHEWRDAEVAAFAPAYWPGPLYHDTSRVLYRALNGCGEQPLRGSLLGMLNPFSAVWARINAARREVPEHNVVGDGLTMGGLLVVGRGDAGVAFMHVERDLGLAADHAQVLAAAKQAAAAAGVKPGAPPKGFAASGVVQPTAA